MSELKLRPPKRLKLFKLLLTVKLLKTFKMLRPRKLLLTQVLNVPLVGLRQYLL
jgi:hypothetical protein